MIAGMHSDFYLFHHLGLAYQALSQVQKASDISCEIIPFSHGQTLVTLSQDEKNFPIFAEGIFLKHIRCFDVPSAVVDAYLGRSNQALIGDLLVYESDFLGDSVRTASQWFKEGAAVLDLRLNRGSGRVTLLSSISGGEYVSDPGSGQFERIKQPTELIKNFFERS